MARREASNPLLHFYHEIGHKQYPTWLVHPQADYQRVVFVGFAARHLYFVIFQKNKRKARVVATALPLLSLGLNLCTRKLSSKLRRTDRDAANNGRMF